MGVYKTWELYWPSTRGLMEKNPYNYSCFKFELLALVWATSKKIIDYLKGGDIEVLMDNPLTYLDIAKLRVLEENWVACLARFKYKIHYRPEKLTRHADALSCYAVECPREDVDSFAEKTSR